MYEILSGRLRNASRVVVRKASEEAQVKEAMKHPDKPGAGAKKRKKLRGQTKVHAVMKEFKERTLHSGSGGKVTSRKQAIAIAMSEAGLSRKAVGDILREDATALLKARGLLRKAKYLRRTGTPGNYRYYYDEPKDSAKRGEKFVDADTKSRLAAKQEGRAAGYLAVVHGEKGHGSENPYHKEVWMKQAVPLATSWDIGYAMGQQEARKKKRGKDSDKLRDQERPTVLGYELDRETLTPKRKRVDVGALGDYGADPVGEGKFRMVPSGDIVDLEERSRRLKR